MKNIKKEFYDTTLSDFGFIPCDCDGKFCSIGQCWELSEQLGGGYYWIYNKGNHYTIKIHDFWYWEDTLVELATPESLSTTYYESISGEELSPYKRLKSNVVKSYFGGYKPFKAMIHKRIPIRSVGIEFLPEYYENYLKKHYGGEYQNPHDAFLSIDETSSFSEMVLLLNQVKNYRGDGIAAKLFFDAKAAEAVSLIFERQKKINGKKRYTISQDDTELIRNMTSYIDDHYADELPLERLAKIACMGTTKLKKCFKLYHDCTITEYIQNRRMGQAEHFLSYTDLSINQVAQAVGYHSASRFAELFRKSTGILPGEYKKIKGKQ